MASHQAIGTIVKTTVLVALATGPALAAMTTQSSAGAAASDVDAAPTMQTETTSAPATASPPGGAKQWHFTIPIGLWPFGVQGPIGVGGFSKDLDLSISDVQELKDRAVGFAFEAGRAKAAALVQVLFLRFQPDASSATLPNGEVVRGSPRLEWFTGELAGAYRAVMVNPGPTMLVVEPLAGVRFTNVQASVQVEEPETVSIGEREVNWVDGFVGFRAVKSFTGHIGASFRGDIGAGGANLTWNAAGSVGYRFPVGSAALTLALGYKAAGIDYESDEAYKFMIDETMSGPTLGLAYSF